MQSFGPYVATAGTVQRVDIPPNSDRVRISNDTPYDVLVAFSVAEPTVVTQTGGDWQEVAPAWTHPTIAIPGSAYAVTALGNGGFNGRVWLLPLDGGGLANNGTVSNRKNLWVTAFAPGETATDLVSATRQHDLTSQPRVVAVPMAMNNGYVDLTPSASLQKFTIAGIQPSLSGVTVQTINAYLYAFHLTLGTVVGVLCTATIDINAIILDNAGNQLSGTGGYNFFHGTLASASNNAAPFSVNQTVLSWQSPYPLWTQIPVNVAGAVSLGIQIQFIFVSNTSCHLFGNLVAGFDTMNNSRPRGIGEAPLSYQTGTGQY